MGEQESAEVIVAAARGGEGPNTRSSGGAKRSMDEADAAKRAEKPEHPQRVGGGTAESKGDERQTPTARGAQAVAGNPRLMEEVLRKENLTAAYAAENGTC